jgi:hypothetical protein
VVGAVLPVVGAALVDDGADDVVASDVLSDLDVEAEADESARLSRELSSNCSAKLAQPPSNAIAISAPTSPRLFTIEKARRRTGPPTPFRVPTSSLRVLPPPDLTPAVRMLVL